MAVKLIKNRLEGTIVDSPERMKSNGSSAITHQQNTRYDATMTAKIAHITFKCITLALGFTA
jgi:hypothetical protein